MTTQIFNILYTHDNSNCHCSKLEGVYSTRAKAEAYLNTIATYDPSKEEWRDSQGRNNFWINVETLQ